MFRLVYPYESLGDLRAVPEPLPDLRHYFYYV